MAQAAAAEPTGMTAVLGGDEQAVLASIEAHGLTPANVNGAGQIVAAGTLEQLAAFAADPPPGARLRPLSVAGAFHTAHMAPAVDALRAAAEGVAMRSPVLALLSNRDGSVVRSGSEWLERIVTQVSAPVRWDRCHAGHGGPRRYRADRAPPGRHPDRAGPPGAAGHGDPGPEDPGRPGAGAGDAGRRATPARTATRRTGG